MKKFFAVLTGILLVTSVSIAQQPQPARKSAPQKMVTPAYQQPVSRSGYLTGAPTFKHEVDLNLSQGYFRTYYNGSKNISDFNVYLTYSYDFGRNIQIGADGGFQSVDSVTRFTLFGTGTYNLDADYANSIFFKGGLGLAPISKLNTTSGKLDDSNVFAFYAAAGKRFKLWDHVSYKPTIAVVKITDIDVQFQLQFLNISLNFN